ncbi:hypothetical protein GCM10022214_34190 [Actinomadura miaoliensis]|uniref:Uncharacterized protein n=1 Tax=Actinomadura miaoliensis TaxID=430685 RepID=A0ABP7VU21_9ACTN
MLANLPNEDGPLAAAELKHRTGAVLLGVPDADDAVVGPSDLDTFAVGFVVT